jgi:glycosyltransferase involved in cell wall biosynthesis
VSPNPLLSVIIPVRNRSGIRLDNCLTSLRWQQGVELSEIEIIISDLASDPQHRVAIDETAERHSSRVVRVERTEIWNRSWALNVGIRAALGERVMCTDADMIFSPDFLNRTLAAFEERSKPLVLCRCHDLPQSVPERPWQPDDFPALREQAELRDTVGTGACQAAYRTFFEEVRGYDEKYVFWGNEDKDMVARAEVFGLEAHWLREPTCMLHQWHATHKMDKRWLRFKNRMRYKFTKTKLVKNKKRWGEPGAPA